MRLVLLIPLMAALSCSGNRQETLSPTAFVEWANSPENGLVVDKHINGLILQLRYLPKQLLAIRDVDETIPLTQEQFDRKQQEHDGLLQFQLKFAHESGRPFLLAGSDGFEERLTYYTTQANRDFRLKVGEDTLYCAMSHFERTYGVVPYNVLQLAFEGQLPEQSNMVLIHDDPVLGIGRVKFTIKEESINNIPQISIP